MRNFCFMLMACCCLCNTGEAQTLAPPSWSKKLNARTVFITTGWQYEMELAKPAQVIASLQISSQTDWQDPAQPAAAVSVSIDGRLCSHVVTYLGREFHHYEVHLGLVTPGVRVLEITRLDSTQIDVKLVDVHIDAYEEDHPQFAVLAHAPVIFGRKEMRYSDVPLLLAYDVRWQEAPANTTRRMKSLTYTVVFSNEDGGTPPVGLLHVWGRYADIEWVYRVEFEPDGKTRKRAYFQGPGHKTMPFRGGYENDRPTLQVATLNNLCIDTLNTKLRFALAPKFVLPEDGLRERLLLQAPWTWRVCAKEARREQRQEKAHTDTTRISDLRNYLFIQFAANPQKPESECGGFFLAKFRRQTGEYASHLWAPPLIIHGTQPWRRQTALPLPAGVMPEDLERLDFIADASGQKIVLTEIINLFSLDNNDLPHIWPPSWKGAIALAPGERVRFYVDDFKMLPEKVLPLPALWSFRADSLLAGNAGRWSDAALDDKSWPLLRAGESWEMQGYAGYRGVAWYRTHFKPDASWRAEKMWLGLSAMVGDYALWLNNKPLRAAQVAEMPENDLDIFDLTPQVQIGKDNVLALRVEGREQPGGLLARPVVIKNIWQAISPALPRVMADPEIDARVPFDYFAQPPAFLGTLENSVSAQITPEGALYTGKVEFMFYGGAAGQPLVCRKKTLVQGYFPVVNYQAEQQGVAYRFEAFALPIADTTAPQAMNYVQATLINNAPAARSVRFAVGMRFRGAEQRLPAQIAFDPLWHYRLVGKFVHRNQDVLCSVSSLPTSVQFSPLGNANQPESIVGMMEYQFTLAPGEIQRVSLCIPQNPVSSDRMRAAQGLTFDCERLREDAMRFWQKFLDRGAGLFVVEDKVSNVWQAQLIYNAIFFGPGFDQDLENPWYAFSGAHLAAAAQAFDAAGYHELADQVLRAGFKQMAAQYELADGLGIGSRENQNAVGWARLISALADHMQFAETQALLTATMPAQRTVLQSLMHGRTESVAKYGAISTEDLPVAVEGLQHAQDLAKLANDRQTEDLAEKLREDLEKDYRAALDAASKKKAAATILPNHKAGERMIAAAVYPARLLSSNDKRTGPALQALRGDYEEGLATTAGQWLDSPLTFDLAQIALQNDDAATTLQDFYALLLHTSATHLSISDNFRAWGERQDQAKQVELTGSEGRFITLLRDMLLRAEGRELYLWQGISPIWLLPDNRLELRNLVSAFGRHSMQATSSAEKLVVDFQNEWRTTPKRVLFRVPEFVEALSARVDGQNVSIDKGYIVLPLLAHRLEINWRNHAGQEPTGYDKAVAEFKREYAGRYEMWKREVARKN